MYTRNQSLIYYYLCVSNETIDSLGLLVSLDPLPHAVLQKGTWFFVL